jgi:DNA-directed RNA polymerase subunit RPC12/RpoP
VSLSRSAAAARRKERLALRELRAARIAEGRCTTCGGEVEPERKGLNLCETCSSRVLAEGRERRRLAERERRAKK